VNSFLYNQYSVSANGVDMSSIPSVGLCVGLCVQKVCCGKTADWIHMPFGIVNGVDRGRVYWTGSTCPKEKGSFGGRLVPICFNGIFV